MQSARYVKKLDKYVVHKKHRPIKRQKVLKLNKLNIQVKAKFTLLIMRGEFGFFYYVFSSIGCYAVGCRSPPNQFKSKNLN